MLKRTIKYTDFDGEECEEIFYFNLSEPELIEMEVDVEGGLSKILSHIIEAKNQRELIARFKQIVLMAYGIKSADGKTFEKSDELRKKFSQSAAYIKLYMELAMDDEAAAVFLKGALPTSITDGSLVDQDKPVTTPDPTS